MLEQAGIPGALAPAGGAVPPAPRATIEPRATVEPGATAEFRSAVSPRVAVEADAEAARAEGAAEAYHPGHEHSAEYYHQQYATGWAPQSRFDRLMYAAWTRPAWLAPLAVLGCMAAAFTYVLQNNPTDAHGDPLGPCAFKALTGYDCPGCGGTRMVWYLLHGNIYEAARYHVVALLAVPVLVWTYIVWTVQRLTGYKLPTKRIPLGVILGYLIAWFVFAVLRNLPWAPFHWFYVS
jgi:hypothetical protein